MLSIVYLKKQETVQIGSHLEQTENFSIQQCVCVCVRGCYFPFKFLSIKAHLNKCVVKYSEV